MNDIEQKVVDAITKVAEANPEFAANLLKTHAKRKDATYNTGVQIIRLVFFILQWLNPLFFVGGMFITVFAAFADSFRAYQKEQRNRGGEPKEKPTWLGLVVGLFTLLQLATLLAWFFGLAVAAIQCGGPGPWCWQRIGVFW
jgi:hypothetical protein